MRDTGSRGAWGLGDGFSRPVALSADLPTCPSAHLPICRPTYLTYSPFLSYKYKLGVFSDPFLGLTGRRCTYPLTPHFYPASCICRIPEWPDGSGPRSRASGAGIKRTHLPDSRTAESPWRSRVLLAYIQEALKRARYELIEDEEPYYGEIPELPGVWATGKTLEECRENLLQAVEDWLLFSIANGFPIPPIGGITLHGPEKATA
ncbi:hypothetical protein HRbin11_01435 [bacterium HR11]|nr:hypothetical protein HRbin11_01435 [bacterium HR11]